MKTNKTQSLEDKIIGYYAHKNFTKVGEDTQLTINIEFEIKKFNLMKKGKTFENDDIDSVIINLIQAINDFHKLETQKNKLQV